MSCNNTHTHTHTHTTHTIHTDDDHQVLLQPLGTHDDCQTDYINASYIDVCQYIYMNHYHENAIVST